MTPEEFVQSVYEGRCDVPRWTCRADHRL